MNCNCQCRYCYIPSEQKNMQPDVFFIEILKDFINQYTSYMMQNSKAKQPQLRFIGGEPYLCSDLIIKLTTIFLSAFPDSITVFNTNGTLINKRSLDVTLKYKKNIYHIISMDGLLEIHDSRRVLKNGMSAFQKAVNGIHLLLKNNYHVFLNMVLDEESIDGFSDLCDFIKSDFGMNSISVSLCSSTKYPMTKDKKFSLLEKTYEVAERKSIRISGHHRLHLAEYIPDLQCRAGEKSIIVNSDGKFHACQRFISNPHFGINSYAPDFQNMNLSAEREHQCNNGENIYLGRKLYELYKNYYPEYLSKNDFDSIIFGVI